MLRPTQLGYSLWAMAAAVACGDVAPSRPPSVPEPRVWVSAAVAAPRGTATAGTPSLPASAPTATATAGTIAPPEASASAPPVVASSPPPTPRPPVLPVPTRTRGKIWCVSEMCDASRERCCIRGDSYAEPEGRCMPKGGGTTMDACCQGQLMCSWSVARACDEAADCGGGVCCQVPMGESWEAHECRPSAVGCPNTACLLGSTCRNGTACEALEPDFPGRAFSAQCSDYLRAPRCGPVTCQRGEVCCWDADAKRGTCAANCEQSPETDIELACSAPEHCASRQCTRVLGGQARFVCGHGGWVSGRICRRAAECPPEYTSGTDAPLLGCLPDPELPPGVKTCQYDYR